MLDVLLSSFQWWRKFRKGRWIQVQVRYAVGCPEYWLKDKTAFEYETIVEEENYD